MADGTSSNNANNANMTGTTVSPTATVTTSTNGTSTAGAAKTPSIEELSLQLAKANAENARFKNSIDKLTHDNAELTKWKRERMTAVEQQNEEETKAKQQMLERIKELETYQAVNEASKRYIEMGMDVELATQTATAEVNGEMDLVMRNIKMNQQNMLEAQRAEWLKSRPDILAGNDGKTITKEQFDAMSLVEKTKLRRADLETYNRLVGKKN